MAIYRNGMEEKRDNADQIRGGSSFSQGDGGRTYCIMAVPEGNAVRSAAADIPAVYRKPARRDDGTEHRSARRRRPNSLLRLAAGMLLTAVMASMPLWMTSDGMLPLMKRISTAAMPAQLTAQSVEIPPTVSSTSQTEKPSSAAPESTASSAAESTATEAQSEGMLPVEEKQIKGSGTRVGDIFVKNSTGYAPDFAALLEKKADCRIKLNAGYQVLIVHTHTTECYAQREDGVYSPDYSPRTTDSTQSVAAVGEVLAQQLEAAGIRTLHAAEVHDHPQYNGSYDRALDTIEKYLREYPSIEMVLDVHRDAITYDDGAKLKPTAVIDGRKAAQVMIISGCDAGGRLFFPDWQSNLTMAMQIQQAAQAKYPGLMRPLSFAPYRYNMHMTPNSLLLEFGTDVNTLDEALYSAELLGDALAELLLGYQV